MIIPATVEFVSYKGSTFGPYRFIAYSDTEHTTPFDLTDYTPIMKIRERANGPVIRELELSVTDGPAGEVTIAKVSDEVTNSSAWPRGEYVWDFMLENPDGDVLGPFLTGPFEIRLSVSRA